MLIDFTEYYFRGRKLFEKACVLSLNLHIIFILIAPGERYTVCQNEIFSYFCIYINHKASLCVPEKPLNAVQSGLCSGM